MQEIMDVTTDNYGSPALLNLLRNNVEVFSYIFYFIVLECHSEWKAFPANIYLFKDNNRNMIEVNSKNTRTMSLPPFCCFYS